MKNIGIIIESLYFNQLAYSVIKNINNYYKDNGNICFSIFYEDLQAYCIEPNFAIYRTSELINFPGDVIATNISTCRKLNTIPIFGNKYFLSWDIEWSRKPYDFIQLEETYLNPGINMLCRSSSHKDLIGRVFNRDAGVIDNFNIDKLLEVL